MIRLISTSRAVLAALSLSVLGLVAIDSKPAEAVVVCGPGGCVARRPVMVAPVARLGVGRVGVGRPGYGYRGGRNMGGPVNRVGRR
jgi:hypothetical protein